MIRGRARCAIPVLAALSVFALPSACAQEPADGETAFRSGRYEAAIAAFSRAATSDSASARAHRGLIRALSEVGRYEEAEAAARRATSTAGPIARETWTALGEVLRERGKLAAAESAFTRAVVERASDSLTAEVNLAVLAYERGRRDEAMRRFDRFIDIYNSRRGRLTAEELTAVGVACRYLGLDEPQLFKDALKAFDEAIATDPTALEPRLRVGELFLEKYNAADAQTTFDEILRVNASHPRALLGAARRRGFDGAPGADSLLKRALEVNPNLVAARVFNAEQLLGSEQLAEARAEAERALAVNPASLDARSVLAAAVYMQGDRAAFETVSRPARDLGPRGAELYAKVAELIARVRSYREAAGFARQAVTRDPKSWRAHSVLGMNLLRLGEIDEGRRELETAFKGDPYDVWTKNTLDLLDTYKDYDVVTSGRFQFLVEKKESALLTPYLTELAEEAYTKLAARYSYAPRGPVRIELYRSHADFSVRTVGIPGLGALGVSFGDLLALDSPGARERGQFNWGSTLWHELAHTFTLGATDNRVPRWLSEGLSVLEERRARPGWGFDVTASFLVALLQDELVPASRMNDGFIRPRYPEQVIHSYYQASLVCEMIEKEWGPDAIPAMLREYKAGRSNDEVLRRVLKIDAEGFDKKFDAYVIQRFTRQMAALRPGTVRRRGRVEPPGMTGSREASREAAVLRADADPGDFAAQLMAGTLLVREGRANDAVPYLERARTLFPEYGGPDSPRWLLARIFRERGDVRRAADELSALTLNDENHYDANVALADLLEQLGDTAGAAAALERTMYIHPYDPASHVRLARLYAALRDHKKAVRERKAVVALNPVDRAEALYQLALAYRDAGDVAAARKEVLRALEQAPSFEKAQDLLLALRQGAAP
ncbi:MAG: tetratricopeptide repeat protein [Gemmatimonadaceae bacterium]